MAPALETIITIVPWPRFQAFQDGQPAIGGKLYSYAPRTSTPKATYVDPGLVTPNTNPVLLDDQGGAYVYLDGFYHLRLTDADNILLWEVDEFQYSTGVEPSTGVLIQGSTGATASASAGAGVVSVPGLVPVGYRVVGVTSTITVAFGTSNGLTALQLGDAMLQDRWGQPPSLAAGTKTNQLDFRAGDQPVAAPSGYVLLLAAIGGAFDATGTLHVTAYWESLPVDTP